MTRAQAATQPRSLRQRYVTDVAARVESDSSAYLARTPPRQSAAKAAIVLIVSALSLTAIAFLSQRDYDGWLTQPLDLLGLGGNDQFRRLVHWGLVSIAGYVLIPVLAVTLILKERLRDYGLRRPVAGSWRPYAVLYVIAVPFIVWASLRADFQVKYPFYELGPTESWLPYLGLWWLVYAIQFVSLEFFFRGFMVFGLAPRAGIAAVFVMVVPYTMIHFNKPPLEALAAVLGGTVLGFLALKTGTIWWGAALHVGVAGTMDVLALAQAGLLW